MWVRSQDKKGLVYSNRIYVDFRHGKYRIINQVAYQECDDYDVLGEYETEERAIEVLNDIHCTLTNGYSLATNTINGTWQSSVVYVMPEK